MVGERKNDFFSPVVQHWWMSILPELTKKGHQGIGQRTFLHENLSVLTDFGDICQLSKVT